MADTHLRFSIGSTFSGEGFKQAQQAVGAVNQNVKKSNEAMGQLAGALGQMDTSMAKGAAAATGMLQAMMTLNVTTIAVQGAMMAFNLYVKKVNEEMEALTARSEAARAAVEKAFAEGLSSRVAGVKAEIEGISKGFEDLTKSANAVTSAMAGVRSAEGQGDIIALQTEKLQAMLEARTEAERQQIEQSYAILTAKANLANVEAEMAVKEDAARQAVVDAKNRVANIEQQMSAVAVERSQLEEVMLVQKMSEDKNWIKTQQKVNELKALESDLESKRISTLESIDVLELAEQKVKQESINAQAQANNQVLQLEVAQKSQTDAALEQATKTRENALRAAEMALAQEEAKKALEEFTQKQKEFAELQQQLADSQTALIEAQETYRQSLLQNGESVATNDYYQSDNFKGGAMPVEIVKGISLQTADDKVDDAIRNGSITTVRDADRMRREEAKLVRDRLNKDSGQRSQEALKYQRLLEQNEKALSNADKHFMEEYEKILESQKKQKESVDKAKEAAEKQAEMVEEIKDKLEELGLS